jgi:hypothetical protein
MSWLACTACGGLARHKPNCPLFVQPESSPVLYDQQYPQEYAEQQRQRAAQPTAYDRAQAEIVERVKALESSRARMSDAQYLDAITHTSNLAERLDAALRRIEQLERDVAALKGPRYDLEGRERWKPEDTENSGANRVGPLTAKQIAPGVWRSNPLTVTNVDVTNGVVTLEKLATHLGCGCEGPFCKGHPFAEAIDQKLENIRKSMELVTLCDDLGIDANGSPLPDEGT